MSDSEVLLNKRYRLLGQLSTGGMGVIYRAEDIQLGRSVAVKTLRPVFAQNSEFLVRFRQEARSLANLSHPNIAVLHDFGQDGNTIYLVMELLLGEDLEAMIQKRVSLSINDSLNLFIQACAGLGFAHRAGLVHADVKSQNIFVTTSYVCKILDFGISSAFNAVDPSRKQTEIWGSPHYLAPECISGEMPTPASDVYAMGIVMFELLTGLFPNNGKSPDEVAAAQLHQETPHASTFNPSIPTSIDQIIYNAMAKIPAGRYRNCDQLGRQLMLAQTEIQKSGQSSAQVSGLNAENSSQASPVSLIPTVNLNPLPPTQPASYQSVLQTQPNSTSTRSKIFISYRRDESAEVSGRIRDTLAHRFGSEAVFIDVYSIPLGIDFRDYLNQVLSECGVLLAVIGDRWLNITNQNGRRLDDPTDFVRLEVQTALNRKMPLIPLLIRGAKMPTEAELPDGLKELAFRNGIAVRNDPDYPNDIAKLISSIETIVK